MQNLSAAQKKAMEKLTNNWQSSYGMGIGRNTLDALERKGLAQRMAGRGALFSPATSIKYRLKPE